MEAGRATRPTCGAKAKSTGEPCRGLPMANGRCRCHGGLTPKGRDWHKPTFVRRKGAKSHEQMERKLALLDQKRQKRRVRLACMTPEQRERHEAWQRTHKPGRAAERAQQRADGWFRDLVAKLDRERAAKAPSWPTDGVFG